jgi:hypothetical protein
MHVSSKALAALCLFLLCLPALSQQVVTSQQTETRSVTAWTPSFGLDNELYPSFVLATSGRTLKVPANRRNYFGDPLGLAAVSIRSEAPNAQVHVEIQIEGLTQVSAIDATLPEAGQYRIAPLLRYDYSKLAGIEQSIPASVTYSVRLNGADLGQQTLSIRVRSVNDVPFEMIDPDGKQQDFSFLFAGYVNESHPFVQSVLQQALNNWHAVNSFDGYQRGPQDVQLQVFALWNVLQRNHIHYSNITTASAASPSGHVYSQAVRFIDQSLRSQQANCADGSVLFASLLYKIGIDPILVLKPGHMFVGYYLDANHKQFEFLETTMLGAGHQPSAMNIGFSPLLHPVQGSESWQQFVQAVQVATNVFNQEVAPALQQHRPLYRVIDVAKARQAGVNAIPRSVR